jgi:ATP-dependent DNA helicase RecG
MAQVCYDLKLMEREGSGYDKIYEILLTNCKQLPETIVGNDKVTVIIRKRILKPEIVSFLNRINEEYQLKQKEMICLGIIAQHISLSAIEFVNILELPDENRISSWLGRLPEYNIILSEGKTKGTSYFVNPKVLKATNFKGKTNLKRIESHRLKELIFQDLSIYQPCSLGEIHERIGKEIPTRQIQLCIEKLLQSKIINSQGKKRWTRYSINVNEQKNGISL